MIPLKTFDVVYINPDAGKYKKRKEQILKTIKPIGFKSVSHVKSELEPMYTTRCLLQATIDAIELFPNHPFILFEDDIEWCGQQAIPQYPENADAVYLGFSDAGTSYTVNKCDGPATFEKATESYARVTNMLSGHAILMISEKYKKTVCDLFRNLISQKDPLISDVCLARMQKGLRVYAPYGRSIFYQRAIYGGQEKGTHVYLDKSLKMKEMNAQAMLWSARVPYLRRAPFARPQASRIRVLSQLNVSGESVNIWFSQNQSREWLIVTDDETPLRQADINVLCDISSRKPHNFLTPYAGVYLLHFSNNYKGTGKWRQIVTETFPQNVVNLTEKIPRIVYGFWTDSTPMSADRQKCLKTMTTNIKSFQLFTEETIPGLEVKECPFHSAYKYLCATHKADYLRVYCMAHHGGGYADIKTWPSDWEKYFLELEKDPTKIAIGYQEKAESDIAGPVTIQKLYKSIIGNGAYIFRPKTAFALEWLESIHTILDARLSQLIEHPATMTHEKAEDGTGYPIEWNEILGRIFHRMQFDYLPQNLFLKTLDMFTVTKYR
jgi:hypothetical protein